MFIGVSLKQEIPQNLFEELQERDAVLWVGKCGDADNEEIQAIARLMGMEWRAVLCEESGETMCRALDSLRQERRNLKERGSVLIIASDEEPSLPRRCLPIFMLDGRNDAPRLEESNRLGGKASLLRLLTMQKWLERKAPQLLVVVSYGDPTTLGNVRGMWTDFNLQSRLIYVSARESDEEGLRQWLSPSSGPPIVPLIQMSPRSFAEECVKRRESLQDLSRLIVRVAVNANETRPLDVTQAEITDFPILDRFDLILERDLASLEPWELTEVELERFFRKSSDGWRPYAAGLPWCRDADKADKSLDARRVINALSNAANKGGEENKLLLLHSEPGAGGTTAARTIAFQAARKGFPTLVAHDLDFALATEELTRFLYRLSKAIAQATEGGDEKLVERGFVETPVLLVLDAQQVAQSEHQLRSLFRSLKFERRAAVILAVVDTTLRESSIRETLPEADVLQSIQTHDLTETEVEDLGAHLNRFLEPKNNARAPSEWVQYFNTYRPQVGKSTPAPFWICLQFWLKRQLDLSGSIQDWLFKHFMEGTSQLSDDYVSLEKGDADEIITSLRRIVLQIAALSMERHSMPESLLPRLPAGYPLSYWMRVIRDSIPSAGLVPFTDGSDRGWVIAHSLLARYLVHACSKSRKLTREIFGQDVEDLVPFQLRLLRYTATAPEMADPANSDLAVAFAKSILKLDRDGNSAFFTEWREVLAILQDMPEKIWYSNRAFNHHVAVSRRRVASDTQNFDATLEERRQQLEASVEHLEYALNHLEKRSNDHERDLNLLNSLARAYQDLATLEHEHPTDGSEDRFARYREAASVYIRRAQTENPNNSYVLLTLAQDCLQSAQQFPDDDHSVLRLCDAFEYISRALVDNQDVPVNRLVDVLKQCIKIAKDSKSRAKITTLMSRGDPVGCVGAVWLLLSDYSDDSGIDFDRIPNHVLTQAMNLLDRISQERRGGIELRLRYEILCALAPQDFETQLDVLDELTSSPVQMDYRMRVEHAILLYQTGRVKEGRLAYTSLRHDLRDSQGFVSVPSRLQFLYTSGNRTEKLICQATVVEEGAGRSWAKVKELQHERVPFRSTDFGQRRINHGTRLSCYIRFGPNGPFLNPASLDQSSDL